MAHSRRARSTEELTLCEVLFQGFASFVYMGFHSLGFLYGSIYAAVEPENSEIPVVALRVFWLALGLVAGVFTIFVPVEVYDILIRVKLRRYLSQRRKEKLRRFMGQGDCPICLEDLNVGFGYVRLRDCMHKFHLRCINRWLCKSAHCPTCRSFATLDDYL